MWWNDKKELKTWMIDIEERIHQLKITIDYWINCINDKFDVLVEDSSREDRIFLAQNTLDKFEDYMKNFDKLNSMINEFKGCVALARGVLQERKQLSEQENKSEILSNILQEIYKIDAIYRAVCEKKDKKPCTRKKVVKKKIPTY